MIQIQLPMSVTATAKLEPKQRNVKTATVPPQQLSDIAMAKSEARLLQRSKNASASGRKSSHTVAASPSSSSSSLWWIHGKAYDLTEFVDRHPGGQEAILLGKGRDCTAMVESYHAFSNQLWTILDKYKVELSNNECKSEQQASMHQSESSQEVNQDFFYSVLKERVRATLLNKGIDPLRDRGASVQRMLYYALIFALWIYTGYYHLSVSTTKVLQRVT
jgi:cytochrome b involved in lipid metabolism